MQSKQELEDWYNTPDPWGYYSNEHDQRRKDIILDIAKQHGKTYKKALDIGAGEGFITKDLPAKTIHAIEISDEAAKRLPSSVKRVDKPQGFYDLIICTGVLYKQYNYKQITDWIKNHASGIVITSNIKSWEINELPVDKQIEELEFPYREYTQKLRVYKW